MFGRQIFSTALFMLVSVSMVSADDWNLWRGPNCDGTIEASGYFAEKSFALDVIWNNSIGSGYSGVSIVDQHIVTTFNDGDSDYLGRIELGTGEEIWRYRIGKIYKAHDGGHDGPVSTPVADQQAVYSLGPRGRLFAVKSSSGSEIWSVDLAKEYGAETPFWGFATTPIIFEDSLIVQANGKNGYGLIAFDKKTGAHRWHCSSGRTEYRSPVIANVNGKHQILAASRSETIGVNPKTGKVLWRFAGGVANDKSPVYVGDGKILLVDKGCQLIKLNGRNNEAVRLWSSQEFRGNYDMPSYHVGHLFGFTERYLTCLNAKTGKRVWRSRKPGGKGLIIVDGHIVILGDHGDVVVAEANPARYIEKSRTNVSDGAAYSWPSFADETIVVRNLKNLVALRPVPASTDSRRRLRPSTRFSEFVDRVESSKDKAKLLDDFLRQTKLPIIEDERYVHFVYCGNAQDVGIRGSMLASGEQDPMIRIRGTNCFYATYEIEPGANWEYQFIVDFDNVIPDPENSRRTPGDNHVSEMMTSTWTQPEFAEPYKGNKRGRIEQFRFKASTSEFSSRVSIYLPHNYAQHSKHSLVVVLDGGEWISRGRFSPILDHIFESEDETPIVAFLHRANEGELGGWRTAPYTNSLANELIPQISARYQISERRTIVGRRGGAVAAVYAALRHPSVFQTCIAISYGRADTVRADAIEELMESNTLKRPTFYVAWNRYEVWRPQSFDCRTQSSELFGNLQKQGFKVSGGESKTGFGWRSWRTQLGNALMHVISQSHSNSR